MTSRILALSVLCAMVIPAQASLFNKVFLPLVNKCPQFAAGTAEIRSFTGYANYEVGRVKYFSQCYTPSFKDDVIAEFDVKTDSPNDAPKQPKKPEDNKCEVGGSVVIPTSRVVGEVIPIVGVPFNLVYMSDRVKGVSGLYRILIPMQDTSPHVTGFTLDASYAGRTIHATAPNTIDGKYDFLWDGKDSLGNDVIGSIPFEYTLTMSINRGGGTAFIPINYKTTYLGYLRVSAFGFGNWAPSIYHFYDVNLRRIIRGDGKAQNTEARTLGGGNLMVASDDASEVYIFNSQGRHLYTKFGLTGENKYEFVHDMDGKLTAINQPYGQNISFTVSSGKIISIQSAKGQTTSLAYDGNGFLKSVSGPDGDTYKVTYDNGGLMTSFQKPEGQTNTFYYDSDGSLVRDYHSSGSSWSLSEYATGFDRIVEMTSRLGRSVLYRVVNSIEAASEFNVMTEDSAGRETYSRNLPFSSTIKYPDYSEVGAYSKDPRFTESARYKSLSQTLVNGRGAMTISSREVSLTDPGDPFSISELINTSKISGRTSTQIFDGPTKQWTSTSPEGRSVVVSLNSYEQPVSIKTGDLLAASVVYGTDGQMSQVSWGDRKTQFLYDGNGFLQSRVNALGQTTSFERDSNGRVLKQTFPDGRQVQFKYDRNGNLTGVTPPGRPTHSFALNAFEAIKAYMPPDVGGPAWTTYAYNFDKQLTLVVRPDGQAINYDYSNSSKMPEHIYAPDRTTTFAYDTSHDRVSSFSTTDGTNGTFSYEGPKLVSATQSVASTSTSVVWRHDDEHRISQIRVNDNSNATAIVSQRYDKDGLLIRNGWMEYSRGADRGDIQKIKLNNAEVNYTYDPNFGELSKIEYRQNNKVKFRREYKRDSLGRISYESRSAIGDYLLYDSSGRFVGRQPVQAKSPSTQYTYDANGNRVRTVSDEGVVTATYDNQDRLLTWGTYSFTYTHNGEMTSKTNSADSSVTNYVYDVFGNLKQVTLPNSDVVSYIADGLNRRVVRKYNGATTAIYLFEDQLKIAAELNGSGNLVKRFVYGVHQNVPDYMEYDGRKYLFVKDVRGSVHMVVDSQNGTVLQELAYDDWGKVTTDTNPGIQPFGFAGGLYDPDTKLVRFGAREYSAVLGRWMSKDPISFNGGDINLYGYLLNEPINFVDIDGLKGEEVGNLPPPSMCDNNPNCVPFKCVIEPSLCEPPKKGQTLCEEMEGRMRRTIRDILDPNHTPPMTIELPGGVWETN